MNAAIIISLIRDDIHPTEVFSALINDQSNVIQTKNISNYLLSYCYKYTLYAASVTQKQFRQYKFILRNIKLHQYIFYRNCNYDYYTKVYGESMENCFWRLSNNKNFVRN